MNLLGPLRSFRTRFLLIVLGVAVLPLLVLGVWLTRRVATSGEELVRSRLETSVNETAARIAQRWMLQRSLLLDAVEAPAVRIALEEGRTGPVDPVAVSALEGFELVRVRDLADRPVITLVDEGRGAIPGVSLPIVLPIHEGPLGGPVGSVEGRIAVSALLPRSGTTPGGLGAILGLYDSVDGTGLMPLPFDIGETVPETTEWGGDRWLTVTRRIGDPPLTLVAAAPVSPFAEPFRGAAREGTLLLGVVGLTAFLLAVLLTTRMTRSLGRLAAAAETVAEGKLDLEVDDSGEDEVGRVGRAFNRMTRSLRRTLQELADHRALAAVGEFAASLAHEIRNPLSAVRLDLQVVEEELPADSHVRRVQRRALGEIERMDATLASALQTARSGRWEAGAVLLSEPVLAAVASAAAAPGGPAPTVTPDPLPAVRVRGDPGALRQLFLNLLLNAREAAGREGLVRVEVERSGGEVVVRVVDDGPGIPEELRPRVLEPLVSGREGGTGLGLSIADRIARAHGGTLEIAGGPRGGTVVIVRLPVHAGEPGVDPSM